MRETNSHIYFWGSFLSNFAQCHFVYKNLHFFTSEQYFMYQKALTFKDEVMANKILAEKDPKKCKKYGKMVKNFSQQIWDELKYQIMIDALILKFTQNEDYKSKLLLTKNKTLVEASPYDHIWGIKLHYTDDSVLDEKNWKGQNLLGKALMEVRETLLNSVN